LFELRSAAYNEYQIINSPHLLLSATK